MSTYFKSFVCACINSLSTMDREKISRPSGPSLLEYHPLPYYNSTTSIWGRVILERSTFSCSVLNIRTKTFSFLFRHLSHERRNCDDRLLYYIRSAQKSFRQILETTISALLQTISKSYMIPHYLIVAGVTAQSKDSEKSLFGRFGCFIRA